MKLRKKLARQILGLAALAAGSSALGMGTAQAGGLPVVGDVAPALPALPAVGGLAGAVPINGILPAGK